MGFYLTLKENQLTENQINYNSEYKSDFLICQIDIENDGGNW